jgi:hypothetical protein
MFRKATLVCAQAPAVYAGYISETAGNSFLLQEVAKALDLAFSGTKKELTDNTRATIYKSPEVWVTIEDLWSALTASFVKNTLLYLLLCADFLKLCFFCP